MRPVEAIVSYSHRDERHRRQLETHLSLLQRQKLLSVWHDRKIGAGTEWKGQIDAHLDSAELILLLVSPDFLASDYCYDVELQRALQRHDAGAARVIPIILRPVDWHNAPFSKLQALPKDAKPISRWADRDEAFRNVVQGIRGTIQELRGGLPTPVSSVSDLPQSPHQTGADGGEKRLGLEAIAREPPPPPRRPLPAAKSDSQTNQGQDREGRIINLRAISVDQDRATIEWETTGALKLRFSLIQSKSMTAMWSIPIEKPGVQKQRLTFGGLEPGERYQLVAESAAGRRYEFSFEAERRKWWRQL